jgi:MYXO-CTERM domain-containing protein
MHRGWWVALGALILAGTAEPATVSLQAAPPTIPNLVAHWGLEEQTGTTADDDSGNANDGTHFNAPVISTNVSPFPGSTRSLQFSQAGGTRVDVPDSPSLSLTGSFTLAAWINTGDTANQQAIIEKWTDTDPGGGYFLRLNANENLSFSVFNPQGGAQGISSTPRVVPLGAWAHVAGTFNSTTGQMTMYVNGAADPSTGTAVASADTTAQLRLGRDYGGNGFNGLMDEARIYNKALTAGEISVLMNGQAPASALTGVPTFGSIALSWTAPPAIAGVTVTYAVYMSTSPGGPWTLVTQGVTGTSYTVNGLSPQDYYFQVVAVSVVASGPATSTSIRPPDPTPRTNDHEEGLLDGKCACGSSVGAPAAGLWAALLALGTATLGRRRRR